MWVNKDIYDRTRFKKNISPAIFMTAMACHMFSTEVLKNSSVTGQASNAGKKKGLQAKPALDSNKLNAIKGDML